MDTENELKKKRSEFLICIIEDHSIFRRGVGEVIESAGYKWIGFAESLQAMEYILNEPPSLILLDINLPKFSGFYILKRIRSNSKTEQIPVIIITGYDDMKQEIKSYILGADCYLPKDCDPRDLLQVIDWLLLCGRRNTSWNNRLCKQLVKLNEENTELRDRLKNGSQMNLSVYDSLHQQGLFATLSHNLKNELGIIKLALNEVKEGEHDANDIEMAERSISYLFVLLNQYMQFFDVAKPIINNIAVVDLIQHTKALLVPRIPTHINLEFDTSQLQELQEASLEKLSLNVTTNQNIVLGALLELVNNAIRATGDKQDSIIIRFKRCDANLCIQVQDNASGIPNSIVDKLLAKPVPSKSGTGLGLWLNKNAIESINGNLYLKRTSQNGTVFEIELPISTQTNRT